MARMLKLILMAAAAGFCGSAQQIPIRGNSFRVEPHTTIRLDANLVLVPVTVTDSRGRVMPNLVQTDFTLADPTIEDLKALSRTRIMKRLPSSSANAPNDLMKSGPQS
jgi:hypothetical protein